MDEHVRDLVIGVVRMGVVLGALMASVPLLVLAERRICAAIQDRVGPNRVGPYGILQPLADAIKNLFKEDLVPDRVDRPMYRLAPLLAITFPLLMFVMIPFGRDLVLTRAGLRGTGTLATVAGAAVGAVLAGISVLAYGTGERARWLFVPLLGAACAAVAGGAVAGFGLNWLAGSMPETGLTVRLQVADPPAGLLFFMGMASLGVYAVVIGGWASNNKFALLGALRAAAQMISYEIVLGLSLLLVIVATADAAPVGTVRMSEIVFRQTAPIDCLGIPLPGWNVFRQPLACLLFIAAGFAENKRLPFDLPECEAELVGGYHTEYSGMRFALFMMGEYLAMVAFSAATVTLFLGGWHVPGLDPLGLSWVSGLFSVAVFASKTSALLFLYIWVRWSIPRFRFDQLMALGWKVMIPLAFLNLAVSAGLRLS